MKIAILFSGRILGFEKSYQNIMNNIVQGNEVDFFISYPKDSDINEMNAFLERFEPKEFMKSDEEYFFVKHVYRKTRGSWHNVMCMYLNRKNVIELFKKYVEENDINYDLVISYRIDYWIHSKLNLQELVNKSKEGFLCIPDGNDYFGINDQMAICNMNMMIEYMSVYNSLEYLLDRYKLLDPEVLLKRYIEYKKMKVFRFPLKTNIIRKKIVK